ncbi:hypothetical protein [Salipiger mucosus]|uniref:hypothetical protein n=1 Tax=Salipiger mucosus TaxID=263378 RepID=UPI0012EB4DB7|nr:hypothetical protein [Salipiger mucosus]
MTSTVAPVRDTLARDTARRAITPVVIQRVEGIPTERAVTCVLDTADDAQLNGIMQDSLDGPTQMTTRIVTDIAFSEPAQVCFRRGPLWRWLGRRAGI